MPDNWRDFLYQHFRFLADEVLQGRQDLTRVAQMIQAVVDDDENDPIESVYQSSLWGLSQIYLEWVGERPARMSAGDLEYLRSRGGMLGFSPPDENGNMISITLVDLFQQYDYEFWVWFTGADYNGNGPSAF